MRRVLLVHQPTDGGVGRHVRDVADGLTERGCEVVLCGPLPPDGLTGHPELRRLDLRRSVAPLPDLASVLGLARIVGRVRPNVVHAHSSKAGAVARLARARHPGVPLVYTPHGYAFAGHFARPAERRAYHAAERVLAPLTSRVICVCDAEGRLARAVGRADRVRVVHNGIAPPPAGPPDPRLVELSQDGPVVVALTLLRPGKGLETLIDAVPRLVERQPRAQVAIVGDGPELGALRARAQARGVADAVRFLGPSADPLSVLRGADVFVHPSWAEAFPYVILEAMSLGRPIVASDVGGVGEALVDRESGLLVAPRDHAALADALAALLERPDWGARMGRDAALRVSRVFTRAAMLDGLTSVYEEVAGPTWSG